MLRHWPAFTAFLLRRGADPARWEPGEAEEYAAVFRDPARARAGTMLLAPVNRLLLTQQLGHGAIDRLAGRARPR